MITPPSLKSGDLIGIVSPAKKIDETIVLNAAEIIRKLGYKVKLGKYVFATDNYFAGGSGSDPELRGRVGSAASAPA